MDDGILQLLFALGLILFGLLGGRRKKKPQARPPQGRAQPPRPPAQPPRPRPQAARPRPAPAPAPRADPREQMLRELERLLGTPVEIEQEEAVSLERTDREDVAREPESAAWTAGIERAAESLETLEEAGGKSHQRFHARYPDAPPPAAEPAHAGPTTAQLRRAIIWSEILAPPVSLR